MSRISWVLLDFSAFFWVVGNCFAIVRLRGEIWGSRVSVFVSRLVEAGHRGEYYKLLRQGVSMLCLFQELRIGCLLVSF
jgi:hypothetical protein